MNTLDLTRFVPVSLDELVADAELLTRVDRKYVLTDVQADELLGALDDDVRVLEIDGRRQARYESVYFDTPELTCYRMCAHQRDRRVKIRTRGYVDSRTAFLEAKTRRGDDLTVKERIAHHWPARDRLDIAGRGYAAAAMVGVGLDPASAGVLTPVITTRYRRAALLLPDGGGRVTIDTDLTWELPDGARLEAPGLVIVETKSAGATTTVDRLLWRAHLRPTPVSKFATGLAALRPDLPRNRWARLLRESFASTAQEPERVAV